jgi:hypothetical protein
MKKTSKYQAQLERKIKINTENQMKAIIRTENAGVHFGTVITRKGSEVILDDSIRLWQWSGACSLSQLAMEGTTEQEECKFAVPIKKGHVVLGVIEVIPCTEEAIKSIEGVTPWKV